MRTLILMLICSGWIHSAHATPRFYGYYASAMDGVGTGNYLSEIAPHANLAWIQSGQTLERLKEAKDLGMSAVVSLSNTLFDSGLRLYPDHHERMKKIANALMPLQGSIAAFYILDEPYWTGRAHQISNTEMKTALEAAIADVKEFFPNHPIAVIFSIPELNESLQIPAGFDWVGFDCYGSWENCQGRSIPQHLAVLKSRKLPHQKILLVPEAFLRTPVGSTLPPSAAEERKLVNRIKKYEELAFSDPEVEAVAAFIWQTFQEGGSVLHGARELPEAQAELIKFGKKIKL